MAARTGFPPRRPLNARRIRRLAVGFALIAAGSAQAASLRYCDRSIEPDARQQDALLRFVGLIKDVLAGSGASVALMARSGTDLGRFGHRYSHAGIALRDHPDTPWSVRQLYFACDEGRPRLFDQGLSGFVFGTDDPVQGAISVVVLPEAAARELARAALDKGRALNLLNPVYSANAYPWATRYQNCNQWVVEQLADAWSSPASPDTSTDRQRAQQWLKSAGYEPSRFDVGTLRGLGNFVSFIHEDDHPDEDLAQAVYHVSMPASIEAWVRRQVPGARRWEFCHRDRQVVVREGWTPLSEGCEPAPGDVVHRLD